METILATPTENPDEYYQENVEPKLLERYLDDLGKSIPWVKQWRRSHSNNPLKALAHHFPKTSEIIRGDIKRSWIDDAEIVLVE